MESLTKKQVELITKSLKKEVELSLKKEESETLESLEYYYKGRRQVAEFALQLISNLN